ncbi:MAG: hypothetical protein QXI19_08065 [Candidatus Caldarchaeum sp.]
MAEFKKFRIEEVEYFNNGENAYAYVSLTEKELRYLIEVTKTDVRMSEAEWMDIPEADPELKHMLMYSYGKLLQEGLSEVEIPFTYYFIMVLSHSVSFTHRAPDGSHVGESVIKKLCIALRDLFFKELGFSDTTSQEDEPSKTDVSSLLKEAMMYAESVKLKRRSKRARNSNSSPNPNKDDSGDDSAGVA